VYFNLKQYQQAISYCYQALPDAAKLKDLTREAEIYHNLGNNYADLRNYKKAEECYQKAIAIAESEKNDFNVANSSLGLADLYNLQQRYEKAKDYALKALELANTNDFNQFKATAINELGMIAFYKKEYGTAETQLKKGLEMSRQYEFAIEIGNSYELLSKLYEEQHKPVEALHYYKLYSAFKDSLFNDNKTQMLSNLQENYEIEKQQQQNQSLQAQNAISRVTIREQKRFSAVVVVALILMAGLAFFVFRGLRKQRKANEVISAQKREVERQKQMLGEKQQEILDSIYYARRIQRSLLPSEKYIDKNLKKLGN
ncbi:MAG: tetratricopeptide repeat protein, partial [Bacteroidia bacterium]